MMLHRRTDNFLLAVTLVAGLSALAAGPLTGCSEEEPPAAQPNNNGADDMGGGGGGGDMASDGGDMTGGDMTGGGGGDMGDDMSGGGDMAGGGGDMTGGGGDMAGDMAGGDDMGTDPLVLELVERPWFGFLVLDDTPRNTVVMVKLALAADGTATLSSDTDITGSWRLSDDRMSVIFTDATGQDQTAPLEFDNADLVGFDLTLGQGAEQVTIGFEQGEATPRWTAADLDGRWQTPTKFNRSSGGGPFADEVYVGVRFNQSDDTAEYGFVQNGAFGAITKKFQTITFSDGTSYWFWVAPTDPMAQTPGADDNLFPIGGRLLEVDGNLEVYAPVARERIGRADELHSVVLQPVQNWSTD